MRVERTSPELAHLDSIPFAAALCLIAGVSFLVGCTYRPDFNVPPLTGGAPLGVIAPTSFVVEPLQNNASEDILPTYTPFPVELPRPSGEIVAEAICREFQRNGHTCSTRVDNKSAIHVSGVAREFQAERVESPWQPSMYEHVELSLNANFSGIVSEFVRDYRILGKQRTPSFALSFDGTAKPYGDYAARMLEVAVQRVVMEFTTDPEFVTAVQLVAEQQRAPTEPAVLQ